MLATRLVVSLYVRVGELTLTKKVLFLKSLYMDMPEASVLALQERLTWVEEMAVAVRLEGIVGGVLSIVIVTEALLDSEMLPAASLAQAKRVFVP